MPLALSVGILAGVLTYFSVSTGSMLHIAVWVSFVAWAAFFVAGANKEAVLKSLIPLITGVLWGWLCITIMQVLTQQFNLLSLSILVGVAALAIVLMMQIPFFELGPAQFLGFASFFGAYFGNAFGDVHIFAAALFTIISLITGVLFGFLSVLLPNLLTGQQKKEVSS